MSNTVQFEQLYNFIFGIKKIGYTYCSFIRSAYSLVAYLHYKTLGQTIFPDQESPSISVEE